LLTAKFAMVIGPASTPAAPQGGEDAAEMAARIASGPGFWTEWLAELEDGLGVLADEFTHAETPDLIRSWFRMLGDWRDAITTLAEDLAEAAGNTIPSIAFPPAMSEAATRYVGHELLDWHRALEGWR